MPDILKDLILIAISTALIVAGIIGSKPTSESKEEAAAYKKYKLVGIAFLIMLGSITAIGVADEYNNFAETGIGLALLSITLLGGGGFIIWCLLKAHKQ